MAGKRLLKDLRCLTSETGIFFGRVVTDWLNGPQISSRVLRQQITGMSLQAGPAGSRETPTANHLEAWDGVTDR